MNGAARPLEAVTVPEQTMKLLTETQRRQLLENAAQSSADPAPVVKLFNPLAQQRWLFTELAEDGDTLFGLADLGFGFPELGNASLGEIAAIRVGFGLRIERDLHFRAKAPLSVYTEAAQEAGRIVEFGSEFEAALARHQGRQDQQARLSVWAASGR